MDSLTRNEKGLRSSSKKKLSGTDQVVEFLNNLEHEFKEEINEVRNIILSVNDQITEHIKWNAPSFCANGQDRITFNLHGKGFFRLIFHCGSKVKDVPKTERLIQDSSGLLEWVTNDRAILKLTSMNEVRDKENDLKEVVRKWIEIELP